MHPTKEEKVEMLDTQVVETAPVLKKTKPVVYYTEALVPIITGQRAKVVAFEHYRLGRAHTGEFLNTSMVVQVGEDGTTFETLNTMYVLRDVPVEAV
jgi:hypothetical protein